MLLTLRKVHCQRHVEAHEQDVLAGGGEAFGVLDGEHRLARPGAAVDRHPRIAPHPLQQQRLIARQLHERLLLLQEGGRHRHLDRYLRGEQVAQHRHALVAGRAPPLASAAVEREHAIEGAGDVTERTMVEDQLRRRIRRQRQRVHGNVRQRNRLHQQQVAAAPAAERGRSCA